MYIARTKGENEDGSKNEGQPLEVHLQNVSRYAGINAQDFDSCALAEFLGALHDYGKYQPSFQEKIKGDVYRSVDHSSAGALLMRSVYGTVGELFGIVISSHHTGLPDFGSKHTDADGTYMAKLNAYRGDEISIVPKLAATLPIKILNKSQPLLALPTYIRMLFSALVDGDYSDSEEFVTGVARQAQEESFQSLLNKLQAKLPKNDGRFINAIRADVLSQCNKTSKEDQGLYTLCVPTGGGKTLSSLSFALNHAITHDLKRIIYVIPYTSIIKQNATVLKEIVGAKNVLEHHSNVEFAGTEEDEDLHRRWATEDWKIPIVVTTNVQFFESLFANKPSKLRKIHSIAKSVIIFDEAQMLPLQYLSPCVSIICELIANYGVTAVLASATQPVLDKYLYPTIKPRPIIDDPLSLANSLKRVKYHLLGSISDELLAEEIAKHKQSLTIVNSRRHAFKLFSMLQNKETFHLSTLMHPIHRQRVLKQVMSALDDKAPVRLISTQLIEAGVDIDFPVVFRSIAGIDSIVQSAGRANREGRLPFGQVNVFDPTDASPPPSITQFIGLTRQVIHKLGENAFEQEGIALYFDLLYSLVENNGQIDVRGILSEFDHKAHKYNFKTAAQNFKLIQDDQVDIIVPETDEVYDAAKKIQSGKGSRNDYRLVSQYSVSVYKKEFDRIKSNTQMAGEGLHILLNENLYSEHCGLQVFSEENLNAMCKCI